MGLLALAALALAVGCGGGEETTTTVSTVPPITPPASEQGSVDPFAAIVGTPLQPTSDTPAEVKSAVEQHRPVVMAFYVTGGTDDAKVIDALKTLQGTYTDVTFVYYDYKAPATYGDLSILVPVDYPPQVIFVDTNGTIRQITTGYVDEGTFNQLVVNIRQG
ncbi:MAG: hypothetical protein M5U22_03160 [Thermoleophilia bacterium]|nr:hypothetical protein [Thermoleophilia bacterium]